MFKPFLHPILAVFLFAAIPIISSAQKNDTLKTYPEICVLVDNDAFTLNKDLDHYYTTGIYLGYKKPARDRSIGHYSTKTQKQITLQMRMFTPIYIGMTDPAYMDRPFAAVLSLAYKHSFYFSIPLYFGIGAEAGWIGPSNRISGMQELLHDVFRMQKALGWKFQINDAPIFNIYLDAARGISTGRQSDIIFESHLAAGNLFTFFRQEVLFRIGKLQAINNSMHYGASIKSNELSDKTNEIYFFAGPGIEGVVHNGSIEGNLIGKKSIYTEKAFPFVYKFRMGFMMQRRTYSFGVVYHWLTKETIWARNHQYVGILFTQKLNTKHD
ncbi:MAG: DUF2219 family protein [Bacteroidales bacterium]|jgi:hypothetical protein|nr:DUF2219 family protein [Bacteroidales bacterium]